MVAVHSFQRLARRCAARLQCPRFTDRAGPSSSSLCCNHHYLPLHCPVATPRPTPPTLPARRTRFVARKCKPTHAPTNQQMKGEGGRKEGRKVTGLTHSRTHSRTHSLTHSLTHTSFVWPECVIVPSHPHPHPHQLSKTNRDQPSINQPSVKPYGVHAH